MNPTSNPPVGGFEERLLGELREFVEARAAGQKLHPGQRRPSAPTRWRRLASLTPRRSLAAVGAVAIAACAAVITISAGSAPTLAQAFPIFAHRATNIPATALRNILQDQGVRIREASLDVHHARAFATSLGTGYVFTDRHANLLCVATPGFAHDWGADCGTASEAKRFGAGGLEMFSPRSVSYVEILPRGATATAGAVGEPPQQLPLPGGVLAVVLRRATVITTHIAGHARTITVRAPFKSRRLPVPTPVQVAVSIRFHITSTKGVPLLTASFPAHYPAHRGHSSYVLETYPIKTRIGCHQGDSILEQTNRNIQRGQPVHLAGGAPTCPGRWRVTVYYAVPNGSTVYPGLGWGQPLAGATKAPKGSGEQIVATKLLTVH